MSEQNAIIQLAERLGVLPAYQDFNGQHRPTNEATARALCAALGFDVLNEEDALAHIASLEAEHAARIAPREKILRAGEPSQIDLDRAAHWTLYLEGETQSSATGSGDVVDLPPLPLGVHRLSVEAAGGEETVWLLSAPPAAPSLSELTDASRVWGVTAALYGLRSSRNSGMGDYRDLGDMAAALGAQGAAFLGVNPVHPIGAASHPSMVSPYSPTHRGFLNPWHIALDGMEPFCGAAKSVSGAGDTGGELADYQAAASVREPALAAAFAAFEALDANHSVRTSYDAFAAEGGPSLRNFALYEALSLRHGPDWRAWPEELQDRRSDAAQEFARNAGGELTFHIWLQWVASEQIGAAQTAAKDSGMALGLYLDLAVGAVPGGAETWTDRQGHAFGATLGAPPDQFGDEVQGWGLAPLSPRGMAAQGYQNFARLLRGAMSHAGAVRIDHALGLGRSFWVPDDGSPGAYVSYPMESLLAIIAIEATRADVLVIGEDLGLVPDGFRERLAEAGLYGVDVMQFARGAAGGLPEPHEVRRHSVASFGNHDTPTIKGYFWGRDLDWRVKLGHLDEPGRDWVNGERVALRSDLGETPDDWTKRIHADLARSEAELVAVQLDDLTGEVEQQNLPGVVDEHPNWRRRAGLTVEEAPSSIALRDIGAVMRDAGR